MTELDYCTVRELTEALAAPLSAEDQTVQSMPDVSPTKWHRAHTTWFFETFVLKPFAAAYEPLDPTYEYLFNSYYEAVGPRHPRPERGLLSRPGVDQVRAYREHVDAHIRTTTSRAADSSDLAAIVELGLHHEQQHQELLLTDIAHVLSRNPLRPAYRDLPVPRGTTAPSLNWRTGGAGVVEVGHDAPGFSFDNEHPRHPVLVKPFEIATRLVTCSEWCEFIDADGYERPELWMADGWALAREQAWTSPLYWERHDGRWWVFTLAGLRLVNGGEPVVNVSWYEADAFARWAGARLPSEAEWEACAPDPPPGAHLVTDVLHPRAARSAIDPGQWYGEAWQWTESAYRPYPGYRAAAGAIGEYNGKFMVNQQVLRGSSCLTPPGHARRTYRNFFPPSARWVYAGVRLARDAA